MSTAIVIDDSISTNEDIGPGTIFEAEIAIGEAYLLHHPDADIIGLNAGVVSGFDNLKPSKNTPQEKFIQAVLDYDRVVLIMDNPLQFNGGSFQVTPKAEARMVSKELNKGYTELQIILVGNVEDMARGTSAIGTTEPLSMVLPPYVTMIVDPRTVLDFGFRSIDSRIWKKRDAESTSI